MQLCASIFFCAHASLHALVSPLYLSDSQSTESLTDMYYLNFPRDHWLIKTTGKYLSFNFFNPHTALTVYTMRPVYTIFVLDILHCAITTYVGWHALCSGWGRPLALMYPGWTFSGIPALSSIGEDKILFSQILKSQWMRSVSAWVQIFYAWRIYVLSRWRIVPIIICIVS